MRMFVTSVMVYNPMTIGPEAGVKEAARMMREKHIGCLLVMEGRKLAGIVTERDIVDVVAFSEKRLAELQVKDIMVRKVITATSETMVEEAADIMIKRNVKKLPIVDNGEVVGIVTERDLMDIVRTLHNVSTVLPEKLKKVK